MSARGVGARSTRLAHGNPEREVILVAESDDGDLVGLVSGGSAERDAKGKIAEIGALYVVPSRQRQGIGRSLLRVAADELAGLGFLELHVGALSADLSARAFYEAMGGREIGQRTFDEEGYLLPLTVYAWPDIASLMPASRPVP